MKAVDISITWNSKIEVRENGVDEARLKPAVDKVGGRDSPAQKI